MALLSVQGLKRIKEGALTIEEVDFSMQKRQRIAICGETGSGKTTLLKILSGKIPFTHGELRLQGQSLKNAAYELIPGHPDIAYLSQHFELRNNYMVHEELSYTNALSKENAALLYHVCRIGHLLHRKTTELSGGERQRVALARQLSSFPLLLVLDEPFSNLDIRHKQIMKAILDDAAVKMDMSYIMVSHDPLDVLSWSDYLMVMHDGKIIQQGDPETVYHHPVNEYAASMLGEYSLLTPSKYTLLSNIPAFNIRKKILLRPEYFKFAKSGSHLLTGRVVGNSFWGSHYITDVLTSQQEWIKIKTERPVAVDDIVFLSFRITQSVLL